MSQPQASKHRVYLSIQEIRKANAARGHFFFEPATMRFFSSRVQDAAGVIGGRYFITSERPPNGDRMFTVRVANDDGSIDTMGEFCQLTRRAAIDHAVGAATSTVTTE